MTTQSVPKTSIETVFYRGKRSGLDPIIKTIKATLIVALVIYAFGHEAMVEVRQQLKENVTYVWLAILGVWGCYVGWTWWGWGGIHYVVTSRKITYESGTFAKTIKSIELWRVRDLIFHRGFLEAIFGIGRISVISRDATGPFTIVGPVGGARKLYDQLNDARDLAVQERGVMAVES